MTKEMDSVVLVFRILGVLAVIFGLMGIALGVQLYMMNAGVEKQLEKAAQLQGIGQIPGVSGLPYMFFLLNGSLYAAIGMSFILIPLYIRRREQRRSSVTRSL